MSIASDTFQHLVDEHYESLYRFAYSLAKNEHEASDLTQQTYLTYANKGHTIRDAKKAKSWLFTTLYREFLKLRRKQQKLTLQEENELERAMPGTAPEVVYTMDAHSALDLLDQINESYRTPLTLFYLKDHSYKEIATILDIPIGTVMSRIARGKTQLRKLLTAKEKGKS